MSNNLDYNIEVSARKLSILRCLVRKRQVRACLLAERACEVLNNNKFTFVNVCFWHKRNEEIGVFWQALINKINKLPTNI